MCLSQMYSVVDVLKVMTYLSFFTDQLKKLEEQKAEVERQLKILSKQMKVGVI